MKIATIAFLVIAGLVLPTASAAGFMNGDTIVRVGSTEVRNLDDLDRALKSTDGSVKCRVFRGYQHYDLFVEP